MITLTNAQLEWLRSTLHFDTLADVLKAAKSQIQDIDMCLLCFWPDAREPANQVSSTP